MAAQEQQQQETHENQEQKPYLDDDDEGYSYKKLLSSYLGLSFTIFLGFLPKNSIPLLPTLQRKNKVLSFKLMQAEEQLKQLHSRRKEDSKANARVVEIFASHRHSWQQEEKRLLQQIDECNEEIAYLKGKVEDFEGVEADLKANIEDLKREISERDEMLNFMSRGSCEVESGGGGGECYGDMGVRYGKGEVSEECFNGGGLVDEMGSVYGQSNNNNNGFGSDFLNSAASRFWSDKASLWQDMQYESLEPLYQGVPWKVDGDSTGVSSKLKLLEQELLNLERIGKADLSKVPSQMRKQAKSDPSETNLSSEFERKGKPNSCWKHFASNSASETNQKLIALQTETGKSYNGGELEGQQAILATRRSLTPSETTSKKSKET
ncbi:hypothetical protein DH2020_036302 [Rehmannia glutinosa]|uniref:Uncharacterized protein n=1 Tax=Rehmannia glutinosa TaxID=99300 RepID=A0ABR0V3U9_REHGL